MLSTELEERQKRASARMPELGVPPIQVRIYFLLLKPVICVIIYYFHVYAACFSFLHTSLSSAVSLHFTFILLMFQEMVADGKRHCTACHQLRTASDKTSDSQIHRVLGQSNKVWCPYTDDRSTLEAFEKEQKERMQAAWRRANEVKRLKKKQLS